MFYLLFDLFVRLLFMLTYLFTYFFDSTYFLITIIFLLRMRYKRVRDPSMTLYTAVARHNGQPRLPHESGQRDAPKHAAHAYAYVPSWWADGRCRDIKEPHIQLMEFISQVKNIGMHISCSKPT